MGESLRTTKLFLDLSARLRGGANTSKRQYLEETVEILDAARAFYLAFFLAHPDKLAERVRYFSERLQAERERLISPSFIAARSSKMPLARRAPASRIWRTGTNPARKRGNLGPREPAIIPLSTMKRSAWHQSVLLALRSQRGKVFLPRQQAHYREMGKAVLLPGLSL
jgi:hypothetical protein